MGTGKNGDLPKGTYFYINWDVRAMDGSAKRLDPNHKIKIDYEL